MVGYVCSVLPVLPWVLLVIHLCFIIVTWDKNDIALLIRLFLFYFFL